MSIPDLSLDVRRTLTDQSLSTRHPFVRFTDISPSACCAGSQNLIQIMLPSGKVSVTDLEIYFVTKRTHHMRLCAKTKMSLSCVASRVLHDARSCAI